MGNELSRVHEVRAKALLTLMVLLAMTAFGPVEIAWLWVGSQLQSKTDSLGLALAVTFVGILVYVIGLIFVLKWLELAWRSVRRSETGGTEAANVLEFVFVVAVGVMATAFAVWFLFGGGLQPTFAPR